MLKLGANEREMALEAAANRKYYQIAFFILKYCNYKTYFIKNLQLSKYAIEKNLTTTKLVKIRIRKNILIRDLKQEFQKYVKYKN
jgi:hypothetical protein